MFGLTGLQGKLLAGVAIAAVGFALGMSVGSWRMAAAENAEAQDKLAQSESLREWDAALQGVSDSVAGELGKSVIPSGTIVVEKEVIKYVETHRNFDCKLDSEWVHAHDASTVPEGSVPTSRAYGPADTVTTSEALSGVSGNYRQCLRESEKLRLLQSWVLETEALKVKAKEKGH